MTQEKKPEKSMVIEHFEKRLSPEELKEIQKIKGLLSPENALKLVLQVSIDVLKAFGRGDEVLIGTEGKYEKYELKQNEG